MLTELYEYATEHNLVAKVGYKPKKIKGYASFSSDGSFIDVIPREKGAEPVLAPDLGSKASGTTCCNPLVEKTSNVLNIPKNEDDQSTPSKFEFFLEMLKDGSNIYPHYAVVVNALESDVVREQIKESWKNHGLKTIDLMGFKVDNVPLEQDCSKWWDAYRREFLAKNESQGNGNLTRCLITGELAAPMRTVPKVAGLMSVGGHTSGDAFLSYNQPAYCSYGLSQSYNASVSEEAMIGVNAALTDLFEKGENLCNTKWIFWQKEKEEPNIEIYPSCQKLIRRLFDGDSDDIDSDVENSVDNNMQIDDSTELKTTINVFTDEELSANQRANHIVTSIKEGKRTPGINSEYYVMPISGASGRMMVRSFYTGNLADLKEKVDLWFNDLQIVSATGHSLTKPPKIKALLLRMLQPGKNINKLWKQMDKELPRLSNQVMSAALNGTPLPDEVASRALKYINSLVYKQDEKTNPFEKESLAFQFLKCWLIRKQRLEGESEFMDTDIQSSPHSAAYNCGRLLEVYAALQEAATNVKSGILTSYYNRASKSPLFVIGLLAQRSQFDFAKLKTGEKPYLYRHYQKMLEDIYGEIDEIPEALDLKQQAEFAVGFYHQRAKIYSSSSKKKIVELENTETEEIPADESTKATA